MIAIMIPSTCWVECIENQSPSDFVSQSFMYCFICCRFNLASIATGCTSDLSFYSVDSKPNAIMVYIESWNEYQKLAEELYEKHPTRVSDLSPDDCTERPITTYFACCYLDTVLCKISRGRWHAGSQGHRR